MFLPRIVLVSLWIPFFLFNFEYMREMETTIEIKKECCKGILQERRESERQNERDRQGDWSKVKSTNVKNTRETHQNKLASFRYCVVVDFFRSVCLLMHSAVGR